MKKLSLIFAFFPLWLLAQDRVMVVADPHVLTQELIDADPDFAENMKKQRKMLHLSEPIWAALMDTAMKYKPALLLIPGDLTRDGETECHTRVSNSLNALQTVGIRTLVIPGNHDLPSDTWETLYSGTYNGAAKDPNSHSYAVEPLEGVTVLGIDGAHGNAGQGYLSDATLSWILNQADAAVAKGNMILAMCHWQLLEHFDKQSSMENACRLKNAEAIRDSLMHHGVHVVLTGHFHVDGITTFRDTTGMTNDSIVEITTGSPITYPCPYRWLTLSNDRASLSVETTTITSLATIPDLYTYSREWMAEHTANLIPTMGKKALGRMDDAIEEVRAIPALGDYAANLLEISLPQTDDAKIDLFQRHLGNTVVELYLLHSDGNEPEHHEADSLAQEVYSGLNSMIDEITGKNPDPEQFDKNPWERTTGKFLKATMKTLAKSYAEEPVQSLVEDVTHWKSKTYSDRTDDLQLTLRVNKPRQPSAVEEIESQHTGQLYDVLGRPVAQPTKGHIYIRNRKKILY